MLFVDKTGRRVVNEKLPYNELAQTFFQWDPLRGEYPYLVLIQVWDQRAQEHSASDEYGRLIVGDTGASDAHVLRGETLDELGAAVRERLARYARRDRRARRSPTTGRTRWPRRSRASTSWRRPASTRTSAAASAPSSSSSTATCARSRGARTRRMWPLSRLGPLLRRAGHRRHAGHQGRPEGDARRPGRRRPGPADPRPVRRRQLRRVAVGAGLLGRRRDARPDHRLRLPRRERRPP